MTIRYYYDVDQGSDEWKALRCGLLTASEMHLILSPPTNHEDKPDEKPSYLKLKKAGWFWEPPATRTGMAEKVSEFLGDNQEEAFEKARALNQTLPPRSSMLRNEKERAHLYELLAQRVNKYVEPHYISDDMMRGREDEIYARTLYNGKYGILTPCGFITNDRWGFTLGYSPDSLVGSTGLFEAKSRRQKYQMETIVEHVQKKTVPVEYLLQIQTGFLVSERQWLDFGSYCGGMPMPVIRTYPDDVIGDAILEAAHGFEQRIKDKMAIYHEVLADNPLMTPTERRVEQDLVI